MRDLFPILQEDDDLLVINKPAGLVCHPTKGDAYSSLISRVRLYFGPDREQHLINRLDRETSGIVIVAKNSTAARELRRLWEDRNVTKQYFAIVHGIPHPPGGVIEAALGKDVASIIAIKDCVIPAGACSTTEYQTLGSFTAAQGSFTLLQVKPLTGRKHQIRIHLAHISHSIVGDKLYGPDENLYLAFVKSALTESDQARLILENHALHCARMDFYWRSKEFSFRAPVEAEFRNFLPRELADALAIA